MSFWEGITGSDLSKEWKAFEGRAPGGAGSGQGAPAVPAPIMTGGS
jgi:hypothetical protein